MSNDRLGNPVVLGEVYAVAGPLRKDTGTELVLDVAGVPVHVQPGDVAAVDDLAAGGGGGSVDNPMTSDLDAGGFDITNVGTVDGRDVSADGADLDAHIAAPQPHSGHATVADLATHEADTSTHGVTTVAGVDEVQTFTNKTLTLPTIAGNSFTNANHSHSGANSGGQLGTGAFQANAVTNAILAAMNPNTVKANASIAVTTPTDVAMATDTVLARQSGNIGGLSVGANTVLGNAGSGLVAAQIVNAQVANNTLALGKLATQAANTVLANAAAGAAAPTAVAVGTNTVFGRVGSNIVAAQLVAAQVATATLTDATLANMGACSVKGRAANSSGVPADISLNADGKIYQRQSGVIVGTAAPVSLDLSSNTNDLGGASGIKGRLFPLQWSADDSGSGLTAVASQVDGQHMELPAFALMACKVVYVTVNIEHNHASDPGDWRVVIQNLTASTTALLNNCQMDNNGLAPNVKTGAPDTLLAFADGARMRVYMDGPSCDHVRYRVITWMVTT